MFSSSVDELVVCTVSYGSLLLHILLWRESWRYDTILGLHYSRSRGAAFEITAAPGFYFNSISARYDYA